jgi:hypothetical protein
LQPASANVATARMTRNRFNGHRYCRSRSRSSAGIWWDHTQVARKVRAGDDPGAVRDEGLTRHEIAPATEANQAALGPPAATPIALITGAGTEGPEARRAIPTAPRARARLPEIVHANPAADTPPRKGHPRPVGQDRRAGRIGLEPPPTTTLGITKNANVRYLLAHAWQTAA